MITTPGAAPTMTVPDPWTGPVGAGAAPASMDIAGPASGGLRLMSAPRPAADAPWLTTPQPAPSARLDPDSVLDILKAFLFALVWEAARRAVIAALIAVRILRPRRRHIPAVRDAIERQAAELAAAVAVACRVAAEHTPHVHDDQPGERAGGRITRGPSRARCRRVVPWLALGPP